jgi:predicted nucleotidyltransferase
MRITPFERSALTNTVKKAAPDAKIWLFGSRVDDRKKGGDIDIAILSKDIDIIKKIRTRQDIVDAIGAQKIDIVVSKGGNDPFRCFNAPPCVFWTKAAARPLPLPTSGRRVAR